MKAVGIKVLKNKLSEYVRQAAQGETILITDRDQVVAELSPPRPERTPILADAMLAEMVREGVLAAPVIGRDAPLPETRPVLSLAELLDEIDSDRADR